MDKFLWFEEENGYLLDDMKGFHYWAYMRWAVYSRLQSVIFEEFDHVKKRKEIADVFSVMKNIVWHSKVRKDNADILFLCHERRVLADGKYEDIYTDKLADMLECNVLSCEYPFYWRHMEPAYTDEIVYLDFIRLYASVSRKIKRVPAEASDFMERKAAEIDMRIRELFHVEIGSGYIYELLKKTYARYGPMKKCIEKFLKRIRPKILIGVVAYDPDKMLFFEMANELGIITIELQHGYIGSRHIGYNYLAERRYPWLPQKAFFFSRYWIDECRFPIGDENKYPLGFPYQESQVKLFKKTAGEKGIIRIIVISEPELDEEMLKISSEIIDEADVRGIGISVVFKLHPHSYGRVFPQAEVLEAVGKFRIVNSSAESLYSIFANSDVQIGTVSTAVFEGLSYNLKTYIYNDGMSKWYMKDLLETGCAKLFDSAKEFVDYIENLDIERGETLSSRFFVPDALENMKEAVWKLLNSGVSKLS